MLGPIYAKHRLRIGLGLVALLGVNFLQLTIPKILKTGIDGLSDNSISQRELLQLALLICAIGILATILRFCWRYLVIGFSRHLERDLRKRIFTHIMTMDGAFFTKYSTGSIMAHGANDLSAVQMACGMGLVAAVDALVMSLAAIFFMFHIHAKLTLFALLPMPVLAIATRILSKRLHQQFDRVQEQFSLMTEFARSSISSIRLLKAYTLETSQTKRFEKLGMDYVHSSIRVAIIQGLLFPVATLVGSSGMLMVLYFGGKLVIKEAISMGDFVAFITYLNMLIWPMMAIGWVTNLVQKGITSLKRIHRLLHSRSHLPGGIAGKKPDSPTFTLQNLNFSYPGSERIILSGFNLQLLPGILGITGPTGCGKTTFCQIIARMFPVADQTLLVGGQDINTFPPQSIQNEISYVGQEPLLFSSTLAENIAFGSPDAEMEAIIRAAKAAAVHDEIMALPDGYDSRTGEKGVTLSGGQRQRVALARALICNRPVLIMDDCLAAVDTATEQQILHNIADWMHGKVVIWVSQRVKQLALADRILVIRNGKIDGLGSYAELKTDNDFFRDIVRRQRLQEPLPENSHA